MMIGPKSSDEKLLGPIINYECISRMRSALVCHGTHSLQCV